ncbi:hypothetical protein BJY54_006975 [Streptomyces nodosus]|uniref:hypothetical protein n=1 Tax=Streptomyces nodosus TaxID=40318 RepID=UPI00123D3C94|nr:hypothetical protein [Streptomyces nodosus]MBB4796271.1 hypothetical protein [Streptomyces nodosus]
MPVASEVGTCEGDARTGPREGEPRGYDGIRRYLTNLQSALTAWTTTAGVTSLREISEDQVEDAVDEVSGYARRCLATALRSLSRALKRERVIFRNPGRDLPVGDIKGIPKSIPSDILMGCSIGDDTARPPRRGPSMRCPARRSGPCAPRPRSLPRHPRSPAWPAAADPLPGKLTHQLAADWDDLPAPALASLVQPSPTGEPEDRGRPRPPGRQHRPAESPFPRRLTLSGLRQDRILNGTAESADPLRLMRLFGTTEQTAMRYVGAAHPERTAKLPR